MPRLSTGSVLLPLWAGLTTLAAPGLRMWLRLRQSRGKEIAERLTERRGIDTGKRPAGRLLWLHAASVGETASVLPVLARLLEADGALTILFTTGTVTAAQLLQQRLDEGLRSRVLHRFVPLDVPGWVRRFLDHWRPDAAAFLESELWPNLIAACRSRGIPLMLINARMSARSFSKWQRVPGLAATLLGSFDAVQARNPAEAERFRALGASIVDAPGDLKLAAPPLPADPVELERLRILLAGRPVWLAASTHPGEEAIVFAAHRVLFGRHPDLLTILAPRHPERGPAIAAEAGDLPVRRRGAAEDPPPRGVWVADTLGELGLWYRLARMVFVGRSLIPPGGGQNLLEPARLGCAIAVGPYTGNFAEHVALLQSAQACEVVRDAAELARFVEDMLADPVRRERMGQAALAAVQGGAGVVEHTVTALQRLLQRSR